MAFGAQHSTLATGVDRKPGLHPVAFEDGALQSRAGRGEGRRSGGAIRPADPEGARSRSETPVVTHGLHDIAGSSGSGGGFKMEWRLAEAKNRFSEVVNRALVEGPQRKTLERLYADRLLPVDLETSRI